MQPGPSDPCLRLRLWDRVWGLGRRTQDGWGLEASLAPRAPLRVLLSTDNAHQSPTTLTCLGCHPPHPAIPSVLLARPGASFPGPRTPRPSFAAPSCFQNELVVASKALMISTHSTQMAHSSRQAFAHSGISPPPSPRPNFSLVQMRPRLVLPWPPLEQLPLRTPK